MGSVCQIDWHLEFFQQRGESPSVVAVGMGKEDCVKLPQRYPGIPATAFNTSCTESGINQDMSFF